MADKPRLHAATKEMEKKLQQRAYIREFMRAYRGREKREMEGLRRQVKQLEADLARLVESSQRQGSTSTDTQTTDKTVSASALSWKDVSLALRERKAAGESMHAQLIAKTNEYTDLVRNMQCWVASFSSIPHVLNASCPTWRNVTLFSNPTSRTMGKSWITKHIYHNAAATFHRHRFPSMSSPDDFHEFYIDFAESGTFDYVHCRQFEEATPYEVVCNLYQHHICSMMLADGFGPVETQIDKEADETTIVHRMKTPLAEQINLLCGVFPEGDDRCIIVAQQIHDDESFKHNHGQRNRLWMAEIHRLPIGRTKRRILHRVSQAFTATSMATMEEEATAWGCNLSLYPEDLREAKYTEFCLGLARMMHVNAARRLRDVRERLEIKS
ncbi:unnamed protein product [Aphanomyces euteiches]|uniref:Uncharacterized protein n=2 Tax=Aphanomyces euteiches TaxID=100861 RepID=A0A6G0XG56_9STRA|nr:hypothetical protein Ae201684_005134 [Aphanomyces euteiches]KAH9080795.1 hypothetical protein Ae201684P_012933 [Aphanomyces euteiches]